MPATRSIPGESCRGTLANGNGFCLSNLQGRPLWWLDDLPGLEEAADARGLSVAQALCRGCKRRYDAVAA